MDDSVCLKEMAWADERGERATGGGMAKGSGFGSAADKGLAKEVARKGARRASGIMLLSVSTQLVRTS